MLSCAEAFECADTVQAISDPMSDGIKMSVRLHMLSTVCHFTVPLPAA